MKEVNLKKQNIVECQLYDNLEEAAIGTKMIHGSHSF